jgi:CHASE2 domain-containing sensor protein
MSFRRDAVAILVVASACGLLSLLPPISLAHGWSIDALTALRWKLLGPHRDAAAAPVVVIAIDEETYETPPFKGSPTLIWTTEIGRVLTAVLDGGAKVAGFDFVFANSIEQSELPFGDDAVGAKLRGFDRPFLRSLAAAASAGKVVLGEALRDDGAVRPTDGQRIAVRGPFNIRPLNILSDPDEVVRRVPLTFAASDKPLPSMALELASRALGAKPEFGADGSVTLAGYPIPKGTLTLDFDGGAADVRTYSLADLRACVERDDKEFFRQFADKIVIFGTLLDAEDRKLTSKRFATGIEESAAPRCALPPAKAGSRYNRSTIAGVYIQATAVNNLLARDGLIELDRNPTIAIAIGCGDL